MKAEDYFKVEKRKQNEKKAMKNKSVLFESIKSTWRALWKSKKK